MGSVYPDCATRLQLQAALALDAVAQGISMHRLWQRYLALLDNDLSPKIFDNFKNMVLCALLLAAGTDALRKGHPLFMSPVDSSTTGWGLIAIAAILMVLNLSDGIRRLSRLRYHTVWQILIVVLYVLISERVVELVWNYRAE
jgi:hypothetical protein